MALAQDVHALRAAEFEKFLGSETERTEVSAYHFRHLCEQGKQNARLAQHRYLSGIRGYFVRPLHAAMAFGPRARSKVRDDFRHAWFACQSWVGRVICASWNAFQGHQSPCRATKIAIEKEQTAVYWW